MNDNTHKAMKIARRSFDFWLKDQRWPSAEAVSKMTEEERAELLVNLNRAKEIAFEHLTDLLYACEYEAKQDTRRAKQRTAKLKLTKAQRALLNRLVENWGKSAVYTTEKRTCQSLVKRGLLKENWECPPGYDYGFVTYELTEAGRAAMNK